MASNPAGLTVAAALVVVVRPAQEDVVIHRLQRRLAHSKARAVLLDKCAKFSPEEQTQAMLYWLKRKRWIAQRDRAAAKKERRRVLRQAALTAATERGGE